VNFVHEQHVARLQIGEQRRKISRPFQHRTGGLAQIHLQLIGDDVCQVVLRVPRAKISTWSRASPRLRALDEDLHLGLDVELSM